MPTRPNEGNLATSREHELVTKFVKSLWNYIMGFIFKQRQIRIYGGKLYGKL